MSAHLHILGICGTFMGGIAAIAKGMSITFMEMFQPTQVENYPDGPGPLRGARVQERYRGIHVLQRDENGLEKCVACFLCAAACPSNCIYIEAAENTETNRVSAGRIVVEAVTDGRPLVERDPPGDRIMASIP